MPGKMPMPNFTGCLAAALFTIHAIVTPTLGFSADYFVDYANGNDSHPGTSKSAAWKHAPGDKNAVGVPGSITLQPGDTVNFKGGIVYRGAIQLKASGTENNHLVYNGSSWGDTPAVISGATEYHINLEKCDSAERCGNSKVWQNLYYAKLKTDFHPFAPVFIDNERYWPSRSVKQKDFFWYDSLDTYHKIKADAAKQIFKNTEMFVPPSFGASTEISWGEPFVSVWIKANKVLLSRVTEVDPARNWLQHEAELEGKLYPKRDTLFSFFNRPLDVDQPGEFAVVPDRDLFVVYPYANLQSKQVSIEIAGQGIAFENLSASHVTISGFVVTSFFGDEKDLRSGLAFQQRTSKTTKRDIRITDNIVRDMASLKGNGAIDIASAENFWISGNAIKENLKNSGIRTYKTRGAYIARNIIHRIGRTGVRIINSEDIVVDGNRITEILGVHGNAMSYYIRNKDVLVINNYVENTQNALTFHGDHKPDHYTNLQVVNNVLLGLTAGWGKAMRGALFAHNVMIDPSNASKGFLLNEANREIVVVNNIIGAWAAREFAEDWTRRGNLYVSLGRTQSDRYGWRLAENEKRAGGLSSLLKTAKAPDFRKIKKHMTKTIGGYLTTEYRYAPDMSSWHIDQPVGPTKELIDQN